MRDLLKFIQKFRNFFLFLLLQIFALTLLFSNQQYHRTWWFSTMHDASNKVMAVRTKISEYSRLDEENERLNANLDSLLGLHKSAYTSTENSFVKIQDTIYRQKYRFLAAKVVNSTTNRQYNYITLNKGWKNGVKIDLGVISPNGMVGKVVAVSENYSTVMSVLHREFTAAVRNRSSGHTGFLKWDANNSRFVSVEDVAKHAPIKEGDLFVSRGSKGTFPEGIPVGTVSRVVERPGSNYHGIELLLGTDFDALGHVQIVLNLDHQEQRELEQRTENEDHVDRNS